MDEKAVAGIALIVIGLFGLVFFFPILIMMVFSGIVSAVVASFVNEALSNMPMYGTLPEVLDWLT
ncbi:MAG: hypothetical protein QXK96_01045, partial [Candidatus Bathyarchaeia archaeon]